MFEPNYSEIDAIRREMRLVNITLEAFDLEEKQWEIRTAHTGMTGESPRTSFLGFRSVFHNFPLFLIYENLFRLTKHTSCSPGTMLTKPEKSIAAQRYSECYTELKCEFGIRPFGMIFPYGNIKGGLIMHNANINTLQNKKGSRLEWINNGEVRYLESYYAVLSWLKNCSWESPLDFSQFEKNGNDCKVTLLQLMRAIKGHSALRVMLFFIHILHFPSVSNHELRELNASIVRDQGGRWIAIPQVEIAEIVGFKIDRVKRALRFLYHKGFLQVLKQGRINLYRIPNQFIDFVILNSDIESLDFEGE